MRIGIISDIHANMEALTASLETLEREGVDTYYCLGDIVGYGAEPSECMAIVRERCSLVIAGNHDWAAIGKTSIEYFNTYAKQATLWTRDQLSGDDRRWLESLGLVEKIGDMTIVHSTLYAPELFDYIQTSYDAYLSLQLLDGKVCFLGHSHVPITFFQEEMISYTLSGEILIPNGVKALVNVGSVGQPRDDNPKSAYAVYDEAKSMVWVKRVAYDVESASRKIKEAGLPEVLGERLKLGR